jgi:hypothetical protein
MRMDGKRGMGPARDGRYAAVGARGAKIFLCTWARVGRSAGVTPRVVAVERKLAGIGILAATRP